MTDTNIATAAGDAHSAVSSVVDAAVDTANAIAESAIDSAQEQVARAEQAAADLAAAALQTEIGRMVGDVRRDMENWRETMMTELSQFRVDLSSLATQVTELLSRPQMVALLTPSNSSQTEQSSSIPPASDSLETLAEVVIPGSVSEAAPVVVAQAAPAPQKAGRRLI